MEKFKHNVEVVYTLATMDLKLKYQNSKLGFLWSFVKPLLQFCTYYIVFGMILHYSDSPDYPLRMFMGVILWTFFTEATSMGMGTYIGKKTIITKIHIKKELMPVSAYFTAIISYLLNMLIFLVAYHIATPKFWRIYSFKNLIICMCSILSLSVFIISINIILANINVLFRDLQMIWDIILTYGCFLTPIMYTLPIPEKFLPLYYFVDPLAVPLECLRTVFFETKVYIWKNPVYMMSYLSAILFWLIVAFFVDKKLRDKVADYL